jgi:hypothetical protein
MKNRLKAKERNDENKKKTWNWKIKNLFKNKKV